MVAFTPLSLPLTPQEVPCPQELSQKVLLFIPHIRVRTVRRDGFSLPNFARPRAQTDSRGTYRALQVTLHLTVATLATIRRVPQLTCHRRTIKWEVSSLPGHRRCL